MGDVVNTDRFPKIRTSKERERLRAKFARRMPYQNRQPAAEIEMPHVVKWRR